MRQPCAKPNWVSTAGRGHAEVLDQVLAQEAHGPPVEQECALPGEADAACVRVELVELLVMQVVDSQGAGAPSILWAP